MNKMKIIYLLLITTSCTQIFYADFSEVSKWRANEKWHRNSLPAEQQKLVDELYKIAVSNQGPLTYPIVGDIRKVEQLFKDLNSYQLKMTKRITEINRAESRIPRELQIKLTHAKNAVIRQFRHNIEFLRAKSLECLTILKLVVNPSLFEQFNQRINELLTQNELKLNELDKQIQALR